MNIDRLAARLAPKFAEEFLKHPAGPCRLFLSASDMQSPAVVQYVSAIYPADAFNTALERLNAALGNITPTILRAEWIVGVKTMMWSKLKQTIIDGGAENFHRGLAFRLDYAIVFTALELDAGLVLQSPDGAIDLERADALCHEKFNLELPKLEPTKMLNMFDTHGVFVSDDEPPMAIDKSGHREVSMTAEALDGIIRRGVRYLEAQLLPSGRFVYGRLPCTDRFVPSYDEEHHRLAVAALKAAKEVGGVRDDRTTVTEDAAKAALDAHFYPEVAMYFKRPSMITGGFFSKGDAFRVRIDDAARALLNLIEYKKNAAIDQSSSEQPTVDQPAKDPKIAQAVQRITELIVGGGLNRLRGEATIFFGGNLLLGRRMNLTAPNQKCFGEIAAMKSADIRIANLLCVLSAIGEPVDKGNFFYFRGRPELANILIDGNIDVALTASHHTGDYGAAAIVDQNKTLDKAGIAHVGSGANLNEASKPIYVKANDLIAAIFAVEAMTKQIGATEDRGGVWHLPFDELARWKEAFDVKIAAARRHADVVFVAIDWEPLGRERSFEQMQAIGRTVIDCGADGVLGCDSLWYERVENYNERPIIYGAGMMLSDYTTAGDSGGYLLTVDANGVKSLTFDGLRRVNSTALSDEQERARINKGFATRSRRLGTKVTERVNGTVDVLFNPAPRGVRRTPDDGLPVYDPLKVERRRIEPMSEPLPEWTVEHVPDEARIEPKKFGELTLVGYRLLTPVLTEYKALQVETYWTIDKPVRGDCRFLLEGRPTEKIDMPFYGAGTNHVFEDWMWSVEQWTPGVIYREKFGLRPPAKDKLRNIDLRVEVRVRHNGTWFGPFVGSEPVKMQLP